MHARRCRCRQPPVILHQGWKDVMPRDKMLKLLQDSVTPSRVSPRPLFPTPLGCKLREPGLFLNRKSLSVQHHRSCWDSPAFISCFFFLIVFPPPPHPPRPFCAGLELFQPLGSLLTSFASRKNKRKSGSYFRQHPAAPCRNPSCPSLASRRARPHRAQPALPPSRRRSQPGLQETPSPPCRGLHSPVSTSPLTSPVLRSAP